jgi:hypothetical protein
MTKGLVPIDAVGVPSGVSEPSGYRVLIANSSMSAR